MSFIYTAKGVTLDFNLEFWNQRHSHSFNFSCFASMTISLIYRKTRTSVHVRRLVFGFVKAEDVITARIRRGRSFLAHPGVLREKSAPDV